VLTNNKFICHRENILSTVHDVVIHDLSAVETYSKSFPCATELIVATPLNISDMPSVMDHFNRIISLTQLTKLTLCSVHNLSEIVNILSYVPNIRTLSIGTSRSSAKENLELEESDTFKRISKQNRIQNIITFQSTLETIQMVIKLCLQLHHLTFAHPGQNIERIVRFLIMKHDPTRWHLRSLRILRTDSTCVRKIKTLVKSKKHLGDYSLKIVADTIYLWY
jgi:hypothetical protein